MPISPADMAACPLRRTTMLHSTSHSLSRYLHIEVIFVFLRSTRHVRRTLQSGGADHTASRGAATQNTILWSTSCQSIG
jgi:hypothetical protein